MTMHWQALRNRCLSFAGSEETFPFGPQTSVFKVAGKMFALSRLRGEPLSVSVKCEPLLAEQLRRDNPWIIAGYHLNKRHWNTIVIDESLPGSMVVEMIEDFLRPSRQQAPARAPDRARAPTLMFRVTGTILY